MQKISSRDQVTRRIYIETKETIFTNIKHHFTYASYTKCSLHASIPASRNTPRPLWRTLEGVVQFKRYTRYSDWSKYDL